jgi:hypothetical protein
MVQQIYSFFPYLKISSKILGLERRGGWGRKLVLQGDLISVVHDPLFVLFCIPVQIRKDKKTIVLINILKM